METTLAIVFGVSSLINAIAMAVSIVLSEKPTSIGEHAFGLAKLMVMSGALCNLAANQTTGYVPAWHGVLFTFGVASFCVVYAKHNWRKAHRIEKLREYIATEA